MRIGLNRWAWVAALAVAALCGPAEAQLVAFPGAQGFGDLTTGGRTGSVYVVTNLNDSGAGSFRDAVSQSNRIVVFAVGGYINLSSAVSGASNITILGQTAPGMGIGVMGHEVSFSDKSNVIVQYMRFREGSSDSSAKASLNLGDLNGGIIDHVSAEFSQYDNIDAVGANSAANNITYQNDLIADPIKAQQLNLHEEGNQTTYLNNLFANAHGRAPLAKSNDQYVNNTVYDYGYAYTTGNSSGKYKYDILNNYFIAGPSTTSPGDAWYQLDANQSAYSSGNLLDGNKNGVLDGSPTAPGGLVSLSQEWSSKTQFLPTLSAAAAYSFDVAHAGDSLLRDPVDSQIITQVQSLGTQGSIYNSQADDGLSNGGFGTIPGATAPTDTDRDGIPDAWETTHGLNPNVADSTKLNPLGYTMIEQYAQQLGDEYATQTWSQPSGDWTPGTWSSATPGIYDHAVVQGNSVVSIAVGDAASAFSVSLGGSTSGTLSVTGGSLVVQDTIYVGAQSNAVLSIGGGTVTANNLQLGNTVWDANGNATSYTGTFNFTGGVLQVGQIVRGAGTPGNWTSGAAWNWNGGTVQAFGNLNINAPATLGAAGAFVNTVGPDGTVYSGMISGVLGGTGPFTKLGAGQLTLSAANTYLGSTTVLGGVLTITGSIQNNGSDDVFVAADPTGATKLVRTTSAGASYDGFGSAVTSDLLSRADIVSGYNQTNNPNGKSIAMAWRQRLSSEVPNLISDAITITGMANSGATGAGQTDAFALQMNFTTSEFSASGPLSEQNAASAGTLHLDWLNPNGGGTGVSEWVNAINGNFTAGVIGDVFTDVQGPWSAFAAMHDITDSNLANYLGSWGVDTTDNEVWAVVDHNSTFGAYFDIANVPEPCFTAGVLLMASVLACRRPRPSYFRRSEMRR
ncbi:MAG: autotransporter-associated beta strand repeat-containing protein [Tepidisphaeraceae bacterium]|jgi:autotransporter-associated beta strand protein